MSHPAADWHPPLVWKKQWLTDPERDLVAANRGLVYWVAGRQTHQYLTHDDFIQIGTLGLIRAAQKYDPSLGIKFSTYAMGWIKSFISRERKMDRMIHIPSYILQGKNQRVLPECREAANRVMCCRQLNDSRTRIDPPAPDPIRLIENIEQEQQDRDRLHAAIERLSPKLSFVVRARLEGRTFEAIGRKINLSKERIRQYEMAAHEQLRELLRDAG